MSIEDAPDLNPPFESDLIGRDEVAEMLRNAAEGGEINADDLGLALIEADKILKANPGVSRELLAEDLVDWYEKRLEAKDNLEA